MPVVDVRTTPPAECDTAALAVGVFAPDPEADTDDAQAPCELTGDAAAVAAAAGIDLAAELGAAGFRGQVGEVVRVPTRGAVPAATLLAVGLGRPDRLTAETVRRGAAAAVEASARLASLGLALVDVGLPTEEAVEAAVEGALLGAYRFTGYRTEPPPFVLESLVVPVEAALAEVATTAVAAARVSADAAALTRDLVNTPPQDKRPPALADRVAAAVADLPIRVQVLDEDALADGGYGGILGVGQGSSQPPRLVELSYEPATARGHVALVGKGITFDTGGISLKPSASMETMKTDMAGAATVLGVIRAAAELELDVRVTAVLALAENMPSGTATRVSDVLTIRGGTTVEVINTDAEGRLVLADALVHVGELAPDVIVDVATLTGAAVVALGDRIGVVMSSDAALATALIAAGERAGEPLWQLPLASEEYGDRVEGAIADLKNAGGRAAGTIFAGLFLHRFVDEGIAWAHLDVAGTAWSTKAHGYHPVGATGTPARTLLGWLRRYGEDPAGV